MNHQGDRSVNQETHERFKKNLLSSELAVQAVEGYFLNKGYRVTVPELHVPGTFEDGKADSGDIILHHAGTDYRVEVKAQPRYTVKQLLRFPAGIIIDKKTTWDAKIPKPDAYYVVDKTMAHACVFNCKQWGKTTINRFPDQVTGINEPCYVGTAELFKVVEL